LGYAGAVAAGQVARPFCYQLFIRYIRPMDQSETTVLITGLGITGTFLSWCCYQQGIDFVVIDDAKENAPSKVAAGIINPVTGRRVVKVWLDDRIIPFAENAYNAIGNVLGIHAISKTSIIDFFPNPFMKEAFLKKRSRQEDYIQLLDDEKPFSRFFNFEFGAGIIEPAFMVNLQELLPAWRNFLKKEKRLIEERLDFSILKVTPHQIHYKTIVATKIIFCDGTAGAVNPYFSLLPFALNKGEAIIIEAPDLPTNHLYKKSMLLAPLAEKGLFWTGTNYLWEFEDEEPTEAFRVAAEQTLKNWLKVPFKIVDHKAAVRPATVERRPFVGFHPVFKNIGILNGMGTKGCSLAPYFAQQLCDHLLHQTPIIAEAAIARFNRVLSRV
jgi:glycine/D-amino acid oxidase-like deaminating enzyme